jgi:protein SCO1/2
MASKPDHVRRLLALLTVAVLAIVATGCGSDSGSEGASGGSGELEGLVRSPSLEVGATTMPQVAEDGTETPFTFTAPEGGLLFVAFGYTNCPDVCPTTLSDIRKAKEQLGDRGDDVEVAVATIDPERDTPEVMNAYVGSFVKSGGHPLRTTDVEQLQEVQDAFQISSKVEKQADGTVEVAHTARSFVIDDTGRVVVEWTFGTSSDAMAADLELLLDQQT